NEPLDSSLVNLGGLTLTYLGADGIPGGGDDVSVPVTKVETRALGRRLSVFPAGTLATGNYQLTIDPSIIADRAGNHAASPITVPFTIRPASDVHAASGFPAVPRAPSANTGQEIGIHVPWSPAVTRVTFPTINGSGTVGTRQLAPSRVDTATQTAYFIVPADANTGNLAITGVAGGGITALPNWVVTRGSVDLDGPGFNDFLPGNGLSVNLNGNPSGAARMESTASFVLAPGTYQLSFTLAGSHQGDPAGSRPG